MLKVLRAAKNPTNDDKKKLVKYIVSLDIKARRSFLTAIASDECDFGNIDSIKQIVNIEVFSELVKGTKFELKKPPSEAKLSTSPPESNILSDQPEASVDRTEELIKPKVQRFMQMDDIAERRLHPKKRRRFEHYTKQVSHQI